MNPLPHFALGQWDAIGRMLYLSDYFGGERTHLSHKTTEARPFLSAEDTGRDGTLVRLGSEVAA